MSRRTETAYKAVIRASQHNMTKSHGFRRNGKCCGCVATVHVLIRGDLLHMLGFPARPSVTVAVMGQKSAKAIVGDGRRFQAIKRLETSPGESGKPYPAEGPNEEEGRRLNELVRHIEPEWGSARAARH